MYLPSSSIMTVFFSMGVLPFHIDFSADVRFLLWVPSPRRKLLYDIAPAMSSAIHFSGLQKSQARSNSRLVRKVFAGGERADRRRGRMKFLFENRRLTAILGKQEVFER